MYHNTAFKRAAEKFVYGVSGKLNKRHRKYSNLSGRKVSFQTHPGPGSTEKTPLIGKHIYVTVNMNFWRTCIVTGNYA